MGYQSSEELARLFRYSDELLQRSHEAQMAANETSQRVAMLMMNSQMICSYSRSLLNISSSLKTHTRNAPKTHRQ